MASPDRLSITKEEFVERTKRLAWLYSFTTLPFQMRQASIDHWFSHSSLPEVARTLACDLFKQQLWDEWIARYLVTLEREGQVTFEPLGIPPKTKDGT